MDASHNAGQLANQSKTQAAEAEKLRQQAAGGYTSLQNLGLQNVQEAGGFGQVADQGKTQIADANQALPGVIAQYQTATGTDAQNANDPYALTPAEQAQLNNNIAGYSSAQSAALQHYQSGLAARGITDPQASSVGAALIQNHYNSQIETHKAQFAEQARQNRVQGLQNLMGYYTGQKTQGLGALESGIAGANNTLEAGAGGVAGLAGQAQGGSAQSQAQSVQQQGMANSAFNSILQLATFAGSGGFSGPPQTAQGDTADPSGGDGSYVDPSQFTPQTTGGGAVLGEHHGRRRSAS